MLKLNGATMVEVFFVFKNMVDVIWEDVYV